MNVGAGFARLIYSPIKLTRKNMKQITIIAILFLTSIINTNAQNSREFGSRRTAPSGNTFSKELPSSMTRSNSAPQRINPDNDDETDMGDPYPISDGAWALLSFGIAYGIYCAHKKVVKHKL